MKYDSIHDFADLTGRTRRVIHAPGALDSWNEVASRLKPDKAIQVEGFLIGLFRDWIDGKRLHDGWAVPEGDLDRDNKFFAVKRIPIRAYFFYSTAVPNTIVISHYVVKKWQNLKKDDIKKVKASWRTHNSTFGK